MPEIPTGNQFLLNAVASLHAEIAALLDARRVDAARIAELEKNQKKPRKK